MLRAVLITLTLAVLGACSSDGGGAPGGPPASDPTFSATLSRGACFGTCPMYRVTITSSAEVTYEGERFVSVTGAQTGIGDPRELADLIDMVDRSGFMRLPSAYRAQVTDLPTYVVTITREGRTHTVTDYGGRMVGMPDAVKQIQDQIDAATLSSRWVGREGMGARAR